jgi:hypothetical protein
MLPGRGPGRSRSCCRRRTGRIGLFAAIWDVDHDGVAAAEQGSPEATGVVVDDLSRRASPLLSTIRAGSGQVHQDSPGARTCMANARERSSGSRTSVLVSKTSHGGLGPGQRCFARWARPRQVHDDSRAHERAPANAPDRSKGPRRRVFVSETGLPQRRFLHVRARQRRVRAGCRGVTPSRTTLRCVRRATTLSPIRAPKPGDAPHG